MTTHDGGFSSSEDAFGVPEVGGHDPEHLTCGCTRRLVRAGTRGVCDRCKRSFDPPSEYAEWPTGTPVGEALEIMFDCLRCSGVVTFRVEVIR